MPDTVTAPYPQDDVSGVLATPIGTDHIDPLRPQPLAAVVEVPAAPAEPAGSKVEQPAAPARASGMLVFAVGAAVLACAGVGLFAWLS